MDRYEDIRLELAAELEELENQQPKDSITEELVRKIVNRSKEERSLTDIRWIGRTTVKSNGSLN